LGKADHKQGGLHEIKVKLQILASQSGFLSDISDELIADIYPYFSVKYFDQKNIIVSQGELSTSIYFLVSGKVRATQFAESGKEISYQELSPGHVFGELSAIDGQPRSTHIIAMENTETLVLTKQNFWTLFQKHDEIAKLFLLRVTELTRILIDRVSELGAQDVNGRIWRELIRRAEGQGVSHDDNAITLHSPPTHQELANQILTHREAVTRELNRLEKSGIIQRQKGKLTIIDMMRLRELIG